VALDKVIAIANNDTVFLSWLYDQKIDDCMGFAVYRRDATGHRTALPAWVGFKGGSNKDWHAKDTTVWPVQKFGWRDFTATRGETYTYDIVPLTGTPDALKPLDAKTLTTDHVTLTPQRGSFATYFTKGILATQALTHVVALGRNDVPDPTVLQGHIDKKDDPLRVKLAGQIIEGVTALLDRAAKDGGTCYFALYELSDPELVDRLIAAKDHIHVILGNTAPNDKENHPWRVKLKAAGVDVTDRMVANGHIAHNKFCLYADATGNPKAVLTGSTNWTPTGLCTQSNNAVVLESDDLAAAYQAFWQRLKADGGAQGAELRTVNRTTQGKATIDGASASSWYSPNTEQTSKPSQGAATPVDMRAVFDAMAQAQNAILFLVFQPGNPSIVEYAAACENAKPGLLVYGAATDPQVKNNFQTTLVHRTMKDARTIDDSGDSVIPASGIATQFAYWQKELLKLPSAHAIIHNKIVVIDPMSPTRCVVVTGSHNQGYRASYNNDENFIMVKGHLQLAQAYATHVMDVYDHYRWRFALKTTSINKAFSGLDTTSGWQNKYYLSNSTARREAQFWTGQISPLPDAPVPDVPQKPFVAKTVGTRAKGKAYAAVKKPAPVKTKKAKTPKKKAKKAKAARARKIKRPAKKAKR
jgi:phosphatidylserine/phosphatidylglycerophosphate/cardiolipin synthase-like enzyme